MSFNSAAYSINQIPVLPTTKSTSYHDPAMSRVFHVSNVSAKMATSPWRFCVLGLLTILAIASYACVNRYELVPLPRYSHGESDEIFPVARLDRWTGEICVAADPSTGSAPNFVKTPGGTICWRLKGPREVWIEGDPEVHR